MHWSHLYAAVAFATILAVVAGLVLSGASAIAHDIYGEIIKKGKVTEKQQVVLHVCCNWCCCFLYHSCTWCRKIECCVSCFTRILYRGICKRTDNSFHNLLETIQYNRCSCFNVNWFDCCARSCCIKP